MKSKKVQALALAAALTVGTIGGAYAATTSQQIQALLNGNVTITYNGQVQTLKDATGQVIYPLSYNGSTYLPVRAVSDMLGLAVNYDAATDTVLLGETEAQPVNLVSQTHTGGTDFSWVINDVAELSIVGSDATQPFQTGVQWEIWNGSMSTGSSRVVYFDVTGYSQISFTSWCDITVDARMYDQDFNVISGYETVAGALTTKTFNIPAGVTQIAFGADAAFGADPDEGTLKILNPVLS